MDDSSGTTAKRQPVPTPRGEAIRRLRQELGWSEERLGEPHGLSGKVISKSDHYKPYPIAGAVLMTVGMALLSRLHEGSSDVLTALYMLLIGIGVGLVMQVVSGIFY